MFKLYLLIFLAPFSFIIIFFFCFFSLNFFYLLFHFILFSSLFSFYLTHFVVDKTWIQEVSLKYIWEARLHYPYLHFVRFHSLFFLDQRLVHCSWDMSNAIKPMNNKFINEQQLKYIFYCFQFLIFSKINGIQMHIISAHKVS